MLGLGYPGGALIEKLAADGDPERIRFPRIFLDKDGFDFSFSGLKSAVSRFIHENRDGIETLISHIAAGFQAAVVDVLSEKLIHAATSTGCRHIAVAGGVAANRTLVKTLTDGARQADLSCHFPPLSFCGDNAAMIAVRGYRLIQDGHRSNLDHDVFSRNRLF
jgi:N6-L-threonylcarbamoyladenine synthase